MKINLYKNFFKDKKIFITGNTGFIGSYLSLTLSLLGSKVFGYSLKKKDKRYLSNSLKYKKKIKTITNDIINIQRYKNHLNKVKPSILIHLASQPFVGMSYKNTSETYETNIFGTVKLLELVKEIKSVKNILIFTSDKVYKNLKGKYLSEYSDLGGIDPYSSSKSCQDIIANSYKESFFKKNKNIIIIRAGNIIGGGDWEMSRLIPDVYNSIYKYENFKMRNPKAIRPWQHILDVINCILMIIIKSHKKILNKSIIYNIGPFKNSNITVKDLVKKIKIKHPKLKITNSKKKYFKETNILKLSNKHVIKNIGWKPLININKSIKLLNIWYKNYYRSKIDVFEITETQIKKFFNLF